MSLQSNLDQEACALMTIRCELCGKMEQIKERLEVRFMFCECGGEYYEYDDLPCEYYPDEDEDL